MNRTAVEQIKERLPVNEVIGQYVKLEKSGASYKAKCPFHNEKSASFFVSPDRGGYYCFGCGAKGDIFTFVEQFEGLDFRGALKVLAERAGVKLVFDAKADGERDRLFQIMEAATDYFEAQLLKSKEAFEYVKKRGINDTTREEFRIGWAPEGWQNLIDYLRSKKFPDVLIEKAGLGKKTDEGKFYDRFRGRIMFPINDSSGRVIAFSGRIHPKLDDGKGAKYLNSPDSPLFDKSQVLYGLDKAKSGIRRMNYSILVEGQMDLVMSHQAGIKNTVASSGTALTAESANTPGAVSNLSLVRRLSPNVILAFDSDKAGRMAAMRAVATTALALGMAVKIADIEGGKDPADIVLANPEDWKSILRGAKHVIEYELNNVLKDVSDPHKMGRAVKDRIFPYLARMDSEMDKALYVKMISDRTSVSEQAVWDDLRGFAKTMKPIEVNSKSETQNTKQTTHSNPEIQGGSISATSAGNRIDLVERRLFGLLALVEKKEPAEADKYRAQIMKMADTSYEVRSARIEPFLSDLVFEAEAFYGADATQWGGHMKELLFNFEEDMVAEELIASMNELKAAEKEGDASRVAELAKKCQVLSMRKGEIARRRKVS
ncbi:MAG: DNA primase [Candidatus Pacebacteria bacterium]|nr:DNA primase [Candidatus Paceibacterota bacterium]